MSPHPADLVVLLDAERRPAGVAPREGVHGTSTPLHLAYSCWVLGPDGRFLLTRRALSKRSWPGVWTNSFCGHPRPGEELVDAVTRGGRTELGVTVSGVTPLLPDFAYVAVDAAGIVENEVCPVFVAHLDADEAAELSPHPDEVAEHTWVTLDDLRATLDVAPWALSPWFTEQAALLDEGVWDALASAARTHSDRGAAA